MKGVLRNYVRQCNAYKQWWQIFKKMLGKYVAYCFLPASGETSIIFPMLTRLPLVLWILMQEMENYVLRCRPSYGNTLMVKYQECVDCTVKSC